VKWAWLVPWILAIGVAMLVFKTVVMFRKDKDDK
jgi:hypothetical protein